MGMMTGSRPRRRSIVYVDGFNLYYGTVRGTRYKWLDLERLFTRLRPDDDLQAIYYFTALVSGPSLERQLTYLRALATTPLVQVVMGRFKLKTVQCRHDACAMNGPRFFTMMEEKRSDVNIALQMIDDAYQLRPDRMILVTGDSDLVPAINLIKQRFTEIRITVYVPARNTTRAAATELRSASDRDRTLPLSLVKKCLFPPVIDHPSGKQIVKPSTW